VKNISCIGDARDRMSGTLERGAMSLGIRTVRPATPAPMIRSTSAHEISMCSPDTDGAGCAPGAGLSASTRFFFARYESALIACLKRSAKACGRRSTVHVHTNTTGRYRAQRISALPAVALPADTDFKHSTSRDWPPHPGREIHMIPDMRTLNFRIPGGWLFSRPSRAGVQRGDLDLERRVP
jgi:hypothetical protein